RGDRRALLIRCFATVALHTAVVAGASGPIQGWVSPEYGRRLPAPVLVGSTRTTLPIRIATLLFPLEDAEAETPDVQPVLSDLGPSGLSFQGDGETVMVHVNDAVTIR